MTQKFFVVVEADDGGVDIKEALCIALNDENYSESFDYLKSDVEHHHQKDDLEIWEVTIVRHGFRPPKNTKRIWRVLEDEE